MCSSKRDRSEIKAKAATNQQLPKAPCSISLGADDENIVNGNLRSSSDDGATFDICSHLATCVNKSDPIDRVE
ncbi:unnamed protein product [Rotaria sp. Silwood2]|nr:unnamed protein product [Rotaria sp. Silwood2]